MTNLHMHICVLSKKKRGVALLSVHYFFLQPIFSRLINSCMDAPLRLLCDPSSGPFHQNPVIQLCSPIHRKDDRGTTLCTHCANHRITEWPTKSRDSIRDDGGCKIVAVKECLERHRAPSSLTSAQSSKIGSVSHEHSDFHRSSTTHHPRGRMDDLSLRKRHTTQSTPSADDSLTKAIPRTVRWNELPEWQRDNKYILSGYRR
jgi:hypothetical protein